jgi:gamma-glutamylcyclotransferase (GGCT)/AIG2-like uncharacterized protein YtfP
MQRVFVYGTLKKGFANHDRIFAGCNIKITPAWTYGELYDLGYFPAMTEGNNKVHGELIEFDDPKVLRKIDQLEGYRKKGCHLNFYERERVTVYTKEGWPHQAWIFRLSKSQIEEIGGTIIPTGRW